MTKKILACILTLALAVTMFTELPIAASVYADETVETGLSVETNDGTVLKDFSISDLKAIEVEEGNKTYKFSAWNANPTYKPFPNVGGPTILGILSRAGITDISSLPGNTLIEIVGGDGVKFTYTIDQLFCTRYYYPNAESANAKYGAVPDSAFDNRTEVPAIINLYADNGRFMYGQVTPNEQNYSAYCEEVLDGGKIVIGGTTNDKWNEMKPSNFQDGGQYVVGSKLYLDMGSNTTTDGIPKFWVHYSTDGSDVVGSSKMYNYDKWGDVNPIIVDKTGPITIKVRVYGHGRYDSDEAQFTVYGIAPPIVPATRIKSAKAGKKNVKVKWVKVSKANGYRVYRSLSPDAGFKAVKTIKKNKTVSYNNKKLKRHKVYYYKVVTLKKVGKKYVEGGYSQVVKAKTK